MDRSSEDLDEEERPTRYRRRRAWRKSWVWWGLIPIAILGTILIVALAVLLYAPPAPVAVVLIRAGSTTNVTAGSYFYYAWSLPETEKIGGYFTATSAVSAYLLSTTQFANTYPNGTPQTSTWSSGNVTASGISARLGPGAWYLDFVDAKGAPNATVDITRAVTATA